MRYTFDDEQFGLSKDGNKVDTAIAPRPQGVGRAEWYKFAGGLSRHLNRNDGSGGACMPGLGGKCVVCGTGDCHRTDG